MYQHSFYEKYFGGVNSLSTHSSTIPIVPPKQSTANNRTYYDDKLIDRIQNNKNNNNAIQSAARSNKFLLNSKP